MNNEQFTDKEQTDYLNKGARYCPHCGSCDVEASQFEADGLCAWSDVTCNDCETEWRDLYTLTAIDKL